MKTDNSKKSSSKSNEKNVQKFEQKSVFNNNDRYSFVFNKQEKIVAALYLITNLMGDQEPIKWQIRDVALKTLTQTLGITTTQLEERVKISRLCAASLTELISLVKIAHIAHHISTMNHELLMREFSLILDTVQAISEEQTDPKHESILSHDFFNTPTPLVIKKTSDLYKGQSASGSLYEPSTAGNQALSDTTQKAPFSSPKGTQKESRQEAIFRLLRNSNNLSVRDFAAEIKDCSEKTIQRELLSLVEQGVLNKSGERRWSTYSLA